jgi:hypothetical protein
MKTREKIIDVWVSHKFDNLDTDLATIILDRNTNIKDYFKAKLIIEIPEKKIEITESEFDIIVGKKKVINAYNYEKVKKELGF